MADLRRFLCRLVTLFRSSRADDGLDREVAAHLALLEDEHRKRGLSVEAARQAARLALGGVDQTKELHRDARSFRWVDNARRDVVYAFRMIRRTPVASTAAVLSLALGVGLNAAIFAVVDWVVVRPLPYVQPHQLVRVRVQPSSAQGSTTAAGLLTPGEFARLSQVTSFRSAAAFSTALRVVGAAGTDPLHAVVARVDGDLFGTLGLQPVLGRSFSPDERSGVSVVVLAYRHWQRQFQGNPAVLGRTLTIDGQPQTIVGVMSPSGEYPADADVWRPLTSAERQDRDRDLVMIARLAEGVSSAKANAELSTLASGQTSFGGRLPWTEDLQRSEAGDVRIALGAVAASGILILLIVCGNVAALLGARGSDRATELGVRAALGATRARLITQIVTEGMALVAIGTMAGLVLGTWALKFLLSLAPPGIPRLSEIVLDWRIIGLGIALTLVIGVLVGVPPALRLSRRGGAVSTPGRRATRRSGTRRGLVFAQVTMAVVLTAGAGLLGRSLTRLVAINNGFAVDRLGAVDLSVRGAVGDLRPLFRDLTAAVESIPDVRGAAFAMQLPTQIAGLRTQVRLNGGSPSPVTATLRPVGARYFEVLDVPIIAGRVFAGTDGQRAPAVAIVNQRFVRDILGGAPAVGTQLAASLLKEPVLVVGVVGDLTPAGEGDRPALYVPIDQVSVGGRMFLLVRSRAELAAITPVLSARVRSIAPNLASDRVVRVADALEQSRAATRFSMQLVTGFAILALLLSVVGVYGMAARDVTVRWRELAVRLALGASHRRALWTIVMPAAAIIGAGAVSGAAIAATVAPSFASLFPGVNARDPITLLVAPLILVVTGLAATSMASARVFRADPAETLRAE